MSFPLLITKIFIVTSMTVLLLFVLNDECIFANSSTYYEGDGGVVFPVKNASIVMKKESVRIVPTNKHKNITDDLIWSAECEFTFFNKSNKEETVTMGYPDWVNPESMMALTHENEKGADLVIKFLKTDSEAKKIMKKYHMSPQYGHSIAYLSGYQRGKLPYIKEAWLIDDLQVLVDNKNIATTHKPIGIKITITKKHRDEFVFDADPPTGAFIWKVRFQPGQTRIVRVSFSFGALNDINYQEATYLLTTGALWADTIGMADIYWSLGPYKIIKDRIYPKGYVIDNNIIHWHFENFEPTEDISIFVNTQK